MFETNVLKSIIQNENSKEKIYSYVDSQNLPLKNKEKLAIWSGTGAESIKAFQLNDKETIKKEFRKKGTFFGNIYDVGIIAYQLKQIINKRGNEVGENIILFKGIKSEDIDLSKFVVGEVNKFDTHMSTSLNLDTAKDFAKDLNDDGYIVIMYTHKKVRGAAINSSFNNAPEEYEILLSESQRYMTSFIDEKRKYIYIFVG